MAFGKVEKALPKGCANVGDIVYWPKKDIEMMAVKINENSIIVEHLEFPVIGREEEFEHIRTVINHKNYQVTKRVSGQ